MEKEIFKEMGKAVEILDIKPKRYVYEVQAGLDIYGISFEMSSGQAKELLNEVIKVEGKEAEQETEVTRGRVSVKKGGDGKYYSVKNIHFHLSDFLELGYSLIQENSYGRLIVGTILLVKLLEQLGVDLEKEQVAVCVALNRAAKHCVITDDNMIKCITNELYEDDAFALKEQEIKNILWELTEMGIVSVEEGRYEVTQELIIE